MNRYEAFIVFVIKPSGYAVFVDSFETDAEAQAYIDSMTDGETYIIGIVE